MATGRGVGVDFDRAVVLLFVNQFITVGRTRRPPPLPAFRVTLGNINGRVG